MRILVVDDHRETRQLVARHLQRSAHVVRAAGSRCEAESLLEHEAFDVAVLDVMLPDGSGIELCAGARGRGQTVPILLLTARSEVRDRVEGLNAGADDYLIKPFALAELLARVHALGRRGPILRDRVVSRGELVIDLERRSVSVRGRPVPLTAREIAIVEVLASRPGVVSRVVLLESVWGEVNEPAQASLDVFIGRIRRKLGPCGAALQTIRGLGYALRDAE